MNRNLLLIVALMLVGVLPAAAQNFSLPQLSPKSPNVAAFDKYGDIPVSPSTGQPQINIPLFATDIGGLPLKIDLSYQCNGFQPKEIASWIGYGWSLMVGGSISWQERGLNDFSTGGVITNWPQISSYRRGLLDATQQFYLFEEVMDQTKEMEFDRFNLSLMGKHQSFYFDTLKRVVLSPKSDLKISMITGGFKVLDIEGNQYFFEMAEGGSTSDNSDLDMRQFGAGLTYMLTRIITNRGRLIRYTYNLYSYNYNITNVVKKYMPSSHLPYDCMSNDFVYGSTHIDQSVLLLDSIVFDEGYVKFIKTAGNRTDMNIFNTTGIPALAGFKVVNNSGKIVSQFNFIQSYNAKLKLDAVQEQVGATSGRRWDFKYFPGGNIDFFTSSVDHWGYYNGASNGTALPNANWTSLGLFPQGSADRTSNAFFSKEGVLSEIRYPTGGSTTFEYEPNQLRVKYKSDIDNLSPFLLWPTNNFPVVIASVANGDSRDAGTWSGSFTLDSTTLLDFNFYRQLDPGYVWDSHIDFTGPSAGVTALESALNSVGSLPPISTATRPVTLPAGTYNWSCNTGKDTYASPMTDLYCFFTLTYTYMDTSALKPPFEFPGLRIRKVISHDSSLANPPIIKEYLYHDSLQNVRLRNVPYYITSVYRWLYDQFNCLPCGTEYTIASESVAPFVGANIEYGKVTELYDSSGRGGKIDYSFMLSSDTKGGEMVQPQVMPFYASWEAGNLLSKRTYKKTGSGYDLVQLDTNTYVTTGGEGYMPGMRLGYYNVCNATILGPNSVTSYRMNSVPIATVQFYQNSSTTRLITNDTITNVKNIGYTSTNHYQQNVAEQFDSEGQSIRDRVVFAKDYPNLHLATAGDALGIRNLADTNMYEPIEVVRIKKIAGVDYVVGATLNTFRPDRLSPAKVYSLRLASPIALSSFVSSTINGSGILIKDPNYEERLSYNKYDQYGNIVEMQEKDNLKKTLIWGYKGMYPIAEVWGADSGSCAHTSFEEESNGLWTGVSATRITTEGFTGKASYQLSLGSLTKTGLNAGNEYILSYWKKINAALSVAGTQGSAQMTMQCGDWFLFTHVISGVTQVVLSGTAVIDEVRLYPKGGQMTTRCMEPMVGMISECSPNNRAMHFEYDALRRLALVRDQNRNIIKKAEYQFGFTE